LKETHILKAELKEKQIEMIKGNSSATKTPSPWPRLGRQGPSYRDYTPEVLQFQCSVPARSLQGGHQDYSLNIIFNKRRNDFFVPSCLVAKNLYDKRLFHIVPNIKAHYLSDAPEHLLFSY